MVVASFTDITKEYNVTLENGKAVNCSCPHHQYRNRICKHMENANAQVQIEIERAATFLALKSQVREIEETAASYRRLFYSAW